MPPALRRAPQPAVLPVDVLRERDARHPRDVDGRIPRLRAENVKPLELLAPDTERDARPRGGMLVAALTGHRPAAGGALDVEAAMRADPMR